ncbi:MAG: D-fructose-6-phosphate amidotransferase [Betaproteobacteria bacterium RIFCSPLOWO2_02_FULL_66_14]|nr:MAG: D-fructose-6-phosphate amidotransferase [Betaproteobacteria bacterium RIFCSPLOWO2_02_FULL_66_14]
MAAYLIGEVQILDPQLYQEYARGVPATIAQYGGRYLVRGGAVDAKEGEWNPQRLVVLEFPSLEQAQRWYASPEYAPLLAIRRQAAKSKILMVDGYAG